MTVPFHASPEFSVGMEMEFQIIDADTLDLADAVMPLLQRLPDRRNVQSEIFQSSVELASPPARTVAELGRAMRVLLDQLQATAGSLGVAICSAGAHPFYRRFAAITPEARYRQQERAAGWLSHHQVTFATHVHLGVDSGDEAVRLMVELKPYLPVLIALSANSPYWQGEDTRFAAFRNRMLATARSYGPPPDFTDWVAFERFMDGLRQVEAADAVADLHWDIRPSPKFGTVEVRVMDAQPTLRDALALAALLRALVRYLRGCRADPALHRLLEPLHWWLQKDNCYVATRYGIDARVAAAEGRPVSLRAVTLELLQALAPYAAADEVEYLERLRRAVEQGLPYQRQRHAFAASSSLQGVVRSLIADLRADAD
jgi:glutamate---cysteine ligase / carboxylate-amine ligase